MKRTWIKNARIVNEGKIFHGSIVIENEVIAAVLAEETVPVSYTHLFERALEGMEQGTCRLTRLIFPFIWVGQYATRLYHKEIHADPSFTNHHLAFQFCSYAD